MNTIYVLMNQYLLQLELFQVGVHYFGVDGVLIDAARSIVDLVHSQ